MAAQGKNGHAAPLAKSTPLVCSGHTRPIPSISFSGMLSDGHYMIISSCKDGKPMLRDWQGDWVGTFLGHKGAVWSAKLNEDASQAVTGSADFSAKVWDTYTGDTLHTFQHQHIVRAVDITPSSSHIFTAGMEKKLRRFDLSRPDAEPEVFLDPSSSSGGSTSHDGNIKSVIWDEKRRLVISASEDKTIKWWDPRAPSGPVSLFSLPAGLASVDRGFPSSSEDLHLAISTGKKAIFLDAETRTPITEHELPYEVSACALEPGKRERFVTGSANDGWVRVYDAATGEKKEENKGHHGPVHSVSYSPDGELYASGSEDGTIRLWQTSPKNYGLWRYEPNGAV